MFLIDILSSDFNSTFIASGSVASGGGDSIYISAFLVLSKIFEFVQIIRIPLVLLGFYILATVFSPSVANPDKLKKINSSNPFLIGALIYITSSAILSSSNMNIVQLSPDDPDKVLIIKQIESVPRALSVPITFLNTWVQGISYTNENLSPGDTYDRFENGGNIHLGMLIKESFKRYLPFQNQGNENFTPLNNILANKTEVRKFFRNIHFLGKEVELDAQKFPPSFIQKKVLFSLTTVSEYIRQLSNRLNNTPPNDRWLPATKDSIKRAVIYKQNLTDEGMKIMLYPQEKWLGFIGKNLFIPNKTEFYASLKTAARASNLSVSSDSVLRRHVATPDPYTPIQIYSIDTINKLTEKAEPKKSKVCENPFDTTTSAETTSAETILTKIDVFAANYLKPLYIEACPNLTARGFDEKLEELSPSFTTDEFTVTLKADNKADYHYTIDGSAKLLKDMAALFAPRAFPHSTKVGTTGINNFNTAALSKPQVIEILKTLASRPTLAPGYFEPNPENPSVFKDPIFLDSNLLYFDPYLKPERIKNATLDSFAEKTSSSKAVINTRGSILKYLNSINIPIIEPIIDPTLDGEKPTFLRVELESHLQHAILSNALLQYIAEDDEKVIEILTKIDENTNLMTLNNGGPIEPLDIRQVVSTIYTQIRDKESTPPVISTTPPSIPRDMMIALSKKANTFLNKTIKKSREASRGAKTPENGYGNDLIVSNLIADYARVLKSLENPPASDYKNEIEIEIAKSNLLMSIFASLGLNKTTEITEEKESASEINSRFVFSTQGARKQQNRTWYFLIHPDLVKILPFVSIPYFLDANFVEVQKNQATPVYKFLGIEKPKAPSAPENSQEAQLNRFIAGIDITPPKESWYESLSLDFDDFLSIMSAIHNFVYDNKLVQTFLALLNDSMAGVIDFLATGSLRSILNTTTDFPFSKKYSSDLNSDDTYVDGISYLNTTAAPLDRVFSKGTIATIFQATIFQQTLRKANAMSFLTPNFNFGYGETTNSLALKKSQEYANAKISKRNTKWTLPQLDNESTSIGLDYALLIREYHRGSAQLIGKYLSDPIQYAKIMESAKDNAKSTAAAAGITILTFWNPAGIITGAGALVVRTGALAVRTITQVNKIKSAIRTKRAAAGIFGKLGWGAAQGLFSFLVGLGKTLLLFILAPALIPILLPILVFVYAVKATYKFSKLILLDKIFPLSYYSLKIIKDTIKIFKKMLLPSTSKNLTVEQIFKDTIENPKEGIIGITKGLFTILLQIILLTTVFSVCFEYLYYEYAGKFVRASYESGWSGTYEFAVACCILVSIHATSFFNYLLDKVSPKTENARDIYQKEKNRNLGSVFK